MNILYLYPNKIGKRNWSYQLFRNEIARHYNVTFYGKGHKLYDKNLNYIPDIIEKYCEKRPDIIMTSGNDSKNLFRGLGDVKDILKVHFLGDYNDASRPELDIYKNNIANQNAFIKASGFDVIFTYSYRALNLLRENKMCDVNDCLPFSVQTRVYQDYDIEKTNDVMAVYQILPRLYPKRHLIHGMLEKMKIKTKTDFVKHNEMIKWINKSKINITSNNYYRSLSARYTETLACGTLLLADRPDDLAKLGFVNGKHLVIYTTLKHLKSKIKYYLRNEKEREKIAQAGEDFVRENHSCEKRVQEMMKVIKTAL